MPPISPDLLTGSIGNCGGFAGPCTAPLASTRRDNPVWEGCSVTGIRTELEIDGDFSVIGIEIAVRNGGKTPVASFLVPIQPTTAEIAFGIDKESFDILGLNFGEIAAGAEVRASGRFRVRGRPKAVWVGVQL